MTDDRRTPNWTALEQARRALRPRDLPPAYSHLTDAELLAALDRSRAGIPITTGPAAKLWPGDPSTWPSTGLEHLTDQQLLARMAVLAADLRAARGHP